MTTGEMNLTRIIIDNIKEIDARDESQIMTELAGEAVSEMFYTTEIFDRKTKKMITKAKLSWAGTKEAARSKGNIVVDDAPIISELDDGVRIVIRVTDLAHNFTIFGGCHQPKKMRVNDVDPVTKRLTGYHLEDDPYYFQKGLSKAQRNGIQTIMPADFIAKCLNKFIQISERQALKPGSDKAKVEKPPSKAALKATTSWEEVTEDMVTDYAHLERIFWDITKKQPAEMYKELGVSNRIDLTAKPWDAFLQLKETFCLVKV